MTGNKLVEEVETGTPSANSTARVEPTGNRGLINAHGPQVLTRSAATCALCGQPGANASIGHTHRAPVVRLKLWVTLLDLPAN